MNNLLRFFAGVLLSALIVIVTVARLAVEVIGASTTPDDFAQLKQRMPAMLSWLFSTPWWVPTLLLFAASGAAGWLIWTGTKRAAAHEMEEHDALDEPKIAALIEERIAALPKADARTDLATHADLHRHDESLAKHDDSIRAVRRSVEDLGNLLGIRFNQVQERVDSIAKQCADLEATIDRVRQHDNDAIRGQFEGVDQSFRALQNREWHVRLFGELESQFEEIAKPVDDGKGIADDTAWKRQIKAWRGKLDEWLVIADWYANGASAKILTIPEHVYEGNWTFDETPLTANQVHRFKEAAVWWHNAKEEKARVERALTAAAFDGPSTTRRVDSPPRPIGDR
jgi:hypothetical protein